MQPRVGEVPHHKIVGSYHTTWTYNDIHYSVIWPLSPELEHGKRLFETILI